MRNILYIVILVVVFAACAKEKEMSTSPEVNWESRLANSDSLAMLLNGTTYLPVYSQIYQLHRHKTYDLTVTVSIRNVSVTDTLYILAADYHDASGEQIRHYISDPVFIRPLETVEIVIDEFDRAGGTGGNIIFDWAMNNDRNEPLFEAVMISTTGQQGLSFTSRGVRIYK